MGNHEPEESMANTVVQSVTEKISSLMELKFIELQITFNSLTSRIEDNSIRLTESLLRKLKIG